MTDELKTDEGMVIKHYLDLAVRGQYVKTEMSLEDLLHLAGEHRRQIENAHHALDMKGAPRKHGDSDLTIAGRIETLEASEAALLETSIHDIRARADKGVRDALVEQTRSILRAADTLSGCLGHCVALLAQIDEARDVELPRLDGVVGSGREAVAAWHAIKPAVEQTLTALDD